jgi:hypothetical protein
LSSSVAGQMVKSPAGLDQIGKRNPLNLPSHVPPALLAVSSPQRTIHQAEAAYDLLDKQSAACLSWPPQQGSRSGQPVAEDRGAAADCLELSSHTFNEGLDAVALAFGSLERQGG